MKKQKNRVFVVGNGMTKFYKPGKHPYEYTDLSKIAMRRALTDAGVDFKEHIEAVYVGYVYGDSCSGQKAVYTID